MHSKNWTWYCSQKQPFRGVLQKRCSKNKQQIYRRTPMTKCIFSERLFNRTPLNGCFCILVCPLSNSDFLTLRVLSYGLTDMLCTSNSFPFWMVHLGQCYQLHRLWVSTDVCVLLLYILYFVPSSSLF